ncbi:MAG: MBL fold metallo-hydrolase [Bacteroidales bacterium]|nr:MBL fold metallo-hydrolase [Bacteroidales bacterium]
MMKRRVFVRTFLLGTGGVMVRNYNVSAAGADHDPILVKMIYNNTGNHPDFKKEWGLAMWIEDNKHAILFDTGGNPETFRKNILVAGIDLSILSSVVISHNHWDHIRGIPVVLDGITQKTNIYVPASNAPEIKSSNPFVNVVPVTDARPIDGSVWSTGEMQGTIDAANIFEQSILIVRGNLVYVFTGCAHPGIVPIVDKAKTLFPDKAIALAAGGFHLINKSAEQIQEVSDKLNEMQVQKIAPSHCTGDKAIEFFRSEWKDRFIDFNIGDDYKI